MLRDEMQFAAEGHRRRGGAAGARRRARHDNAAGADMQLVAERKRGAEGVAAVINLPACRGPQVGLSQSAAACTESDAQRTTICSVVPSAAVVNDVQLFLRTEDSKQSWGEAMVQAGQDAGGAKFVDSFFERGREGDTKEICMNLASWGSDKGRSARILVRYVL